MVRITEELIRWKNTCLLRFVTALACLMLSVPAWTKEYHALIIKSGPSAVYSTIEKGIIGHIEQATPGNFIFTRTIVGPTTPHINKDSPSDYDIIVSIGLSATREAISLNVNAPILATLVPRQSFERLVDEANRTIVAKSKIGALFLDTHPEQELLLAKIIFGTKKKISLLTSKPNSSHIEQIKSLGKKHKLNLSINTISPNENLIKELSTILPSSDALFASPDPLIFNRKTAKSILLTAYRYRVPVIGYSQSYVKAGSLAAVYSTPDQIAEHASEIIINTINGNSVGRHYPKYFSVSINKHVAHSLGILVPDESIIKKKIQRMTGSSK
jgi:putative ABC transport system substrate-binding protein